MKLKYLTGFPTMIKKIIKQKMKTVFKNILIAAIVFWMATDQTLSQIPDSVISELIAVTTRPSADSITLRWAPMNFNVWQLGNNHGYKIERYVIARNGSLLREQEKLILSPSIKALPEDQWEFIVKNDKYAAIAAQALFGDRFEIDLSQSDIFTIVNKVRENDQRFAFALFSADMSPRVAMASGLWYSDKQVKKGEKYLYRVVINSIDSLRGSIFISPDDIYELPKPQNFKADFKDQLVSLKWDKNKTIHYTAYIVERSDDGKRFTSIYDSPLVTVSPTESEDTRYDYAIDSLKDLSKIYYYQVKGITPFGEESPPSGIASGKGTPSVNQVPYISSVESIENTSLHVRWDFPDENNPAIKGFTLERSSESKGNFAFLTRNVLSPETRNYEDKTPQQVNYYRVTAHGLDGELYPSHVYFAQLIDSIPPAFPLELKANINEEGTVTLSWKPNEEADIYGYRIYKANLRSEELAQITSEPIAEPSFIDHVNLNTLNETVYYSVMSIDRNQNHSALSELLKVSLPDKIKPQAPVLLPVKSNSQGVALAWIQSSSEDVMHYAVYRKAPDKPEWEPLKIVNADSDTVYYYNDESSVPGKINHYTVVAVDEAGLESDPTYPVSGSKIDYGLRPAIAWKKYVINIEQNQVTLGWNYNQSDIQSFRIFKAVDNNTPILFKTLAGDKKKFVDTLIPGQLYKYRIIALFEDGNKSLVSEEVTFQY